MITRKLTTKETKVSRHCCFSVSSFETENEGTIADYHLKNDHRLHGFYGFQRQEP